MNTTTNLANTDNSTAMSIKNIEKLLTKALLNDGEMSHDLYEHELEGNIDYWKASMREDNDDYGFAITENKGNVAMIVIEKSGVFHVNEQAIDALKSLWMDTYEQNVQRLIPMITKEINELRILFLILST